MARTQLHEALLLRCIDIGEADRFCILFTRKRGRLAARAKGVRRLGSRMGGTLLPFSHVRLELTETEHSAIITGASILSEASTEARYEAFARMQQGVELLLHLTEEDEPLPQVFDLLLHFFHAASLRDCSPVLPFTVRLLHLLGLLPSSDEDRRYARLSVDARHFIKRAMHEESMELLCDEVPDAPLVKAFVDGVLLDHLKQPLKAGGKIS